MSELDDIAARHPAPAPKVEWLSLRVNGDAEPSAEDLALFHEAFTAGMDAIAAVLRTGGAWNRRDIVPTMTVFPLTHAADVHAELVQALTAARREITALAKASGHGLMTAPTLRTIDSALAKATS